MKTESEIGIDADMLLFAHCLLQDYAKQSAFVCIIKTHTLQAIRKILEPMGYSVQATMMENGNNWAVHLTEV